jgi:hypothetical protein
MGPNGRDEPEGQRIHSAVRTTQECATANRIHPSHGKTHAGEARSERGDRRRRTERKQARGDGRKRVRTTQRNRTLGKNAIISTHTTNHTTTHTLHKNTDHPHNSPGSPGPIQDTKKEADDVGVLHTRNDHSLGHIKQNTSRHGNAVAPQTSTLDGKLCQSLTGEGGGTTILEQGTRNTHVEQEQMY